ncbi:MAG: class I SAM-dependent methyltransferase [Armatimonadetes bacterium]|nr:class I SAM-dependent methyltransferase [Armatimonadota bacterium]
MSPCPRNEVCGDNSGPWWRRFFASPDCLWLGRFPDAEVSRWEAKQVAQLVGLRPGMVVADIPCGPGRHMPTWAEHGCVAVGLDASPMMLRLAADTISRTGADGFLVAGLMQQLPFADATFDAFLMLFNSFGYMKDDEDNYRVLREAARCLRPEGVFLLDTRNRTTEILTAPYRELDTLLDGRVVSCSSRYDTTTRRLHTTWSLPSTGEVIYTASIRLYGPEELAEAFEAAGLSVEAMYGDFAGTPFTGDHAQLVLVGRKH